MINAGKSATIRRKLNGCIWVLIGLANLAGIATSILAKSGDRNQFNLDSQVAKSNKNISPILRHFESINGSRKSENINSKIEENRGKVENEKKGSGGLKTLLSKKISILKIKKFGKKENSPKDQLTNGKTNKKMLSSNKISYETLLKRKKRLNKRKKKIERLTKLKQVLKRKQTEQKANLITDRTLLNLINRRVIADDLFDQSKSGQPSEKKHHAKAPGNSIESEILYNKKTESLAGQIEKLQNKIRDLKFHQTNTVKNVEELVDDEGGDGLIFREFYAV